MNEAMGATCAEARQPRYLNLLEIQNQLMDIHQHINDINMKLGVRPRSEPLPPPAAAVNSIEPPKMPAPESLVSVLEQLPSMVSSKVTQIHSLLNDLEENLT